MLLFSVSITGVGVITIKKYSSGIFQAFFPSTSNGSVYCFEHVCVQGVSILFEVAIKFSCLWLNCSMVLLWEACPCLHELATATPECQRSFVILNVFGTIRGKETHLYPSHYHVIVESILPHCHCYINIELPFTTLATMKSWVVWFVFIVRCMRMPRHVTFFLNHTCIHYCASLSYYTELKNFNSLIVCINAMTPGH